MKLGLLFDIALLTAKIHSSQRETGDNLAECVVLKAELKLIT